MQEYGLNWDLLQFYLTEKSWLKIIPSSLIMSKEGLTFHTCVLANVCPKGMELGMYSTKQGGLYWAESNPLAAINSNQSIIAGEEWVHQPIKHLLWSNPCTIRIPCSSQDVHPVQSKLLRILTGDHFCK